MTRTITEESRKLENGGPGEPGRRVISPGEVRSRRNRNMASDAPAEGGDAVVEIDDDAAPDSEIIVPDPASDPAGGDALTSVVVFRYVVGAGYRYIPSAP